MELRVWVDGTQRVVCGVKLNTTCQQIVFALAHATKQAGRFTMVERWRNEERLLSPNEQPLVTLQRWGEHMNEVEFILRKTTITTHCASPNPTNLPRPRYADEHPPSNPPALPPSTIPPQQMINNQQLQHMRVPHNGYQLQQPRQSQQQQQQQQQLTNRNDMLTTSNLTPDHSLPQQQAQQLNHDQLQQKNYSYEDLYSIVNKKKPNLNPPAVPAKPRLVPSGSAIGINHLHQHSKSNFLLLPQNMCSQEAHQTNRPRCPPGYIDYMEAMANRNSFPHTMSSDYSPQNHMSIAPAIPTYGNTYSLARSQSSMNMPVPNTNYNRLSTNGLSLQQRLVYDSYDINAPPSLSFSSGSVGPRFSDPGLALNQASATNIRPVVGNYKSNLSNGSHEENPSNNIDDSNISVAQMGLDMLKVIEEQKKLLINQKNELERLDSDIEFWETKDSKQNELINKIEEEIRQLEELWKENQAQIQKLENQDFEKEIQKLKAEQVQIETDIDKQKSKLFKFEEDISACLRRLEQLEAELVTLKAEHDENISDGLGEDQLYMNMDNKRRELSNGLIEAPPQKVGNDSSSQSDSTSVNKSGDDVDSDDDDESCCDASDDCGAQSSDSKARSPKVVDKRGLINGIRSLKLDRPRSQLKQADKKEISPETIKKHQSRADDAKLLMISKPSETITSPESNGHPKVDETAKNSKYEFLMNL